VGVPADDVVAFGVVTRTHFGAGAEVHPPNAAHKITITITGTAREDSDRGVGCERLRCDEHPARGCVGVVTSS
jgi:hypothetical protein